MELYKGQNHTYRPGQRSISGHYGSATTVKDDKVIPLLVKGVNVEEADRIYNLREAIYAGTMYVGSRDALIGRQLADELNAGVGDKITLVTSSGNDIIFTIAGLYDLWHRFH